MIYRTEISTEKYRAKEHFKKLIDSEQVIEIKNVGKKRSLRQNRSLYLWFELVSKEFNDAGIDMRKFIEDGIDIPFTPETVKSHLWKPVMEGYLEKTSTTELKSKDIDKIYDILNKHIGERTGLHIPFPNKDYNAEY